VSPGSGSRHLLLLRHAKSDWGDPDLADHDRRLAPRGERAVRALTAHLAGTGLVPDLVLCSTARRTVETWEGLAAAWPSPSGPDVVFERDLYGISVRDLLGRIRAVPGDTACLLVIGHNPTTGDLAQVLAGSGDDDLRRRLSAKFPTGALATLAVPGPWSSLAPGGAALADFVVPRDLPDPDPVA
jgi:phosphohistidine phosphatase